MAELFRVRAKSGRTLVPRRLAHRLGTKQADVLIHEGVPDDTPFELLIDDDRRLHVRQISDKVNFTPSEAEMAEYRELERSIVSGDEFADTMKKIKASVTKVAAAKNR